MDESEPKVTRARTFRDSIRPENRLSFSDMAPTAGCGIKIAVNRGDILADRRLSVIIADTFCLPTRGCASTKPYFHSEAPRTGTNVPYLPSTLPPGLAPVHETRKTKREGGPVLHSLCRKMDYFVFRTLSITVAMGPFYRDAP